MPYFFVFLVAPIAVAIALYRRNPRRFLDGPSEDAPLRLLRWAVGLLSHERAEWGQAMLGELGHLDGRWRRMRFALGCTGAALVLPPWGRAAVGLWATIAATAASLIIYTSMTVQYGLGVGGWIALAVVGLICVGYLLGASALLRRPGYRAARPARRPVRDPGRTRAVRVHPDRPGHLHRDRLAPRSHRLRHTRRHRRRRYPVAPRPGRGPARRPAGRPQRRTAATALRHHRGRHPRRRRTPDADGGYTVTGTVSDRLGNNIVHLLVGTLIITLVGWAAAALAGYLVRRPPTPAAPLAADPIQGA